jgi:hypothetical protein
MKFEIGNNNTLTVQVGEIENQKGDVLVCWSAKTLKAGPPSFYHIHKKAGSQLSFAAMSYEPFAKEGDAFSTIAGFLDFNLVIHAVVPSEQHLFNIAFFNIINTAVAYKKDGNMVRSFYFNSPVNDYELIIDNFLTYHSQLSKVHFVLMVDNEVEYKKVTDKLTFKFKPNIFKRLWRKLNLQRETS